MWEFNILENGNLTITVIIMLRETVGLLLPPLCSIVKSMTGYFYSFLRNGMFLRFSTSALFAVFVDTVPSKEGAVSGSLGGFYHWYQASLECWVIVQTSCANAPERNIDRSPTTIGENGGINNQSRADVY